MFPACACDSQIGADFYLDFLLLGGFSCFTQESVAIMVDDIRQKGTIARSTVVISTPLFFVGVALCLAVGCGASYLAVENGRLRSDLFELHGGAGPQGVLVPKLYGATLAGIDESLDFPRAKPVIFIAITRDCEFCKENWSWWRKIEAEMGNSATLKVVDLKGSYAQADAVASGINAAEVLRLDPASARQAGFSQTPMTAVVSKDGILVKSWLGVF
jgi:hypothetical protein